MKHWRRDNDFTVRQSFSMTMTSKLVSVRLFLACGCIQKSTIISIKATTTGTGTERTGCQEKIHSFTYICLDGYFSMFSRERRGLMA
jgi:hypothetical protein